MSDPVDRAARIIRIQDWCLDDAGERLPQTTRPDLVWAMLRMLKVRAGARVLEIGTGSGYSTALLAVLTGSKGRVTSIDIDPEVVERARKRVTLHGLTHVDVQCADGRRGYVPAVR